MTPSEIILRVFAYLAFVVAVIALIIGSLAYADPSSKTVTSSTLGGLQLPQVILPITQKDSILSAFEKLGAILNPLELDGDFLPGNVLEFSSTSTGIVTQVQDSGIMASSIVTTIDPITTGNLDFGSFGLVNVGEVTGLTTTRQADNIVSNQSSATTGNVPVFADATGLILEDSGADVVGQPLVGFTSTQGTITSADTLLSGIEKLKGNNGALFANFADVSIATTAALVTMISTSHVGSLTLAAAQATGMVVNFDIVLSSTTPGAGDTFSIIIAGGPSSATPIFTFPLTIPATTPDLDIHVWIQYTVQAAALRVLGQAVVGSTVSLLSASPAYNPALAQVIIVSGQWSTSANTMIVKQLTARTSYPG